MVINMFFFFWESPWNNKSVTFPLFFFSILQTLPHLPFLPPSLFSVGRDNTLCRKDTVRISFRVSLTDIWTLQENVLLGNALRCRQSRKGEMRPKKDPLDGLSGMAGGRGPGAWRPGKAFGVTWWKVQLPNHSVLCPTPPWVTQVFPTGFSLWRTKCEHDSCDGKRNIYWATTVCQHCWVILYAQFIIYMPFEIRYYYPHFTNEETEA